jgi:hypothetical protein
MHMHVHAASAVQARSQPSGALWPSSLSLRMRPRRPPSDAGGMWGAARGAPTPPMLESLAALDPRAKASKMQDIFAINSLLWPAMRAAGARQHDAFSCLAHGEGAAGISTGWPHPRAGGEHVGAVYSQDNQGRLIDLDGLLKEKEACPPQAAPLAAERRLLVLGSGDDGGGGSPSAPRLTVAALAPQGRPAAAGRRARPEAAGTAAFEPPSGRQQAARVDAAGSGPPLPELPLLEAFELRYVFVEAASPCPASRGGAKLSDASAAVANISDGGGGPGSGPSSPADDAGAPASAGPVFAAAPAALEAAGGPGATDPSRILRLPVLSNYTHLAGFTPARYPRGCTGPVPAAVPQYHERFGGPQTHYDAYPAAGLTWARLLMVSDAWARSEPALAIAEGLPALAHALSRLPNYGRILLPDGAGTDALMAVAAALSSAGMGGQAAAGPLDSAKSALHVVWGGGGYSLAAGELLAWRAARWALPQKSAPWLAWAYRAVVLTSPGRPLAALPRLGPHWVDAADPADATDADAAFATAAYQLRAAAAAASLAAGGGSGGGGGPASDGVPKAPPGSGGPAVATGGARGGCRVVLAAPSGSLAPGDATAAHSWSPPKAMLMGATPPEAFAHAVAGAAVLVASAGAPPLYLGLLPAGADVVFVAPPGTGGGSSGAPRPRAAGGNDNPPAPYPLFCATAGARCMVVEAGGAAASRGSGGGAAASAVGSAVRAALERAGCSARAGQA